MPIEKEELQERAQLVRVHEANCAIDHPTAEESNFRLAIMKRLAERFTLRELRAKQIDGPVTAANPRLATSTRR